MHTILFVQGQLRSGAGDHACGNSTSQRVILCGQSRLRADLDRSVSYTDPMDSGTNCAGHPQPPPHPGGLRAAGVVQWDRAHQLGETPGRTCLFRLCPCWPGSAKCRGDLKSLWENPAEPTRKGLLSRLLVPVLGSGCPSRCRPRSQVPLFPCRPLRDASPRPAAQGATP